MTKSSIYSAGENYYDFDFEQEEEGIKIDDRRQYPLTIIKSTVSYSALQ